MGGEFDQTRQTKFYFYFSMDFSRIFPLFIMTVAMEEGPVRSIRERGVDQQNINLGTQTIMKAYAALCLFALGYYWR